jgi:hypothetical protein
MSSDKKEDEFFVPRGTKETTYEVDGKTYSITVHVPDNYEHDKMMEEFTSFTDEETVLIRGADLAEARILRFLKRAPFLCGKVEWQKASEAAKIKAIRTLKPKHRAAISKAIVGMTELSQEEKGFFVQGVMGGIPDFSITDIWNMANTCIDLGWEPEQYYRSKKRDVQAIIIVQNARMRKQQMKT